MGYRRPHHRRAHIRTNSDGSKSYVKDADVKGHRFERQNKRMDTSERNGGGVDELLATIALACLLLFFLGVILGWDDTIWYFVGFLLSGFVMFMRKK